VNYDLIDLRLLVLIAETGGFAPAARAANMSVSALSERVKALETQAGTPFFERSARGSRPTRAGIELAGHARAVLLQAERLNGAVASWRHRQSGTIRLLANSNAIISFMPDLLAAFMARYPDVVVDLHEDTSDSIARALRAGDADVGIAAGNAKLDGLDLVPFRRDRLVLLVPAGHRLADARSVGFAELLDEQFIGLDEHSAIHVYVGQQAQKLGRELGVRLKLRSFEGVCRMVVAGAGVAILPSTTVGTGTLEAGAHVVQLADAWAERKLVICLPRDRPIPALVRLLVDEIAQGPSSRFEGVGRRERAAKMQGA